MEQTNNSNDEYIDNSSSFLINFIIVIINKITKQHALIYKIILIGCFSTYAIANSNIKKKIFTKAILMKFFKISLLFLIIIFSINQSKYKVFNIVSKRFTISCQIIIN